MKMTQEQKDARKEIRRQERIAANEAARIQEQKNQKHVKTLTITIEWKRSRMWGNNPHAEGSVMYRDGSWATFTATASGCGYDKESTVVASIFNDTLRYKLWMLTPEQLDASDGGARPYGINNYSSGRGFSGGIGMSCYPRIAEYIGGKMEHVASGNTFDVWKYTDEREFL